MSVTTAFGWHVHGLTVTELDFLDRDLAPLRRLFWDLHDPGVEPAFDAWLADLGAAEVQRIYWPSAVPNRIQALLAALREAALAPACRHNWRADCPLCEAQEES